MVKQRVAVRGQSIVIDLRQKSGSVWTATGEYRGQTIIVEGPMASGTARLWEEIAASRGDGDGTDCGQPWREPGTPFRK